jgi:tRNA dimethylallyltransferase
MVNTTLTNPPVIFLMGPTASGKTALAVDMVQNLPVDIVSVDSAMVYRGMDIGTAKPPAEILQIAPHRLIDICDPTESYSAGSFCRDARQAIADIHATGRIPLLVGGTGLYFRSLEQGFSTLPQSDPLMRQQLEAEASANGWEKMHSRLAAVDPVAAARIHPNDPQRIQRALEVYALTGKPLSEFHREGRSAALSYPILKLVVAPAERAQLHKDIETRFKMMLNAGLVDEVKGLYACGDLSADLPAMRLVGYRQVWEYLQREITYNDMINKGIVATRQLARRQLTWLRAEKNAHWFESARPELSQYLLNFIREKAVIV